ncbi:hypothetical protein EDD90_3243 [Streptomyces sp. Ag109_O5-1]|uniref:hypothetical protein n=1 Tax=Streptomyces sp. Ag109_O5-1 TaxID=1938851 RepID=UPI000F50CA21|nr:hypothetical protein [Streptomyces sp. Ag109_O5-1]RPE40207.1 hypothetical protein EDD90_3243 [Streptomyces sp. Ag109_O5-1]
MNTKSVNSAAGVILAALAQNRTAAGIALALESAGLLMSPEAAADLASTSTDAVVVAEQAVEELKREHEVSARLRDRLAELEAWKARDEEVQPHRQAIGAANMRMIGVLELRIRRVRMLHSRGWGAKSERCEHDGQPWPCSTLGALDAAVGTAGREASVDGITQRIAPMQALREVPDGEHYAATHHDYRLSHDLPETGGPR